MSATNSQSGEHQGTHWEGCGLSGPRHYECLRQDFLRLSSRLSEIEHTKAEAPEQRPEASCLDRSRKEPDASAASTAPVASAPCVVGALDVVSALRPFALWADSMYTLKDDDKVCGIYVRYFRDAAKVINGIDAPTPKGNE